MTRVLDYGNEGNYGAARASAWQVYRRLLGYALRYKYKLTLTIVLSLVVAASFTSMLFTAATALGFLLDEPAKVEAQVQGVAAKINDFTTNSAGEPLLPALAGADNRFLAWVETLRAEENTSRAIAWICGFLLVLSLIAGIARYFQEYFAGAISAGISVRINEEMFANILAQDQRFFDKYKTGEVVARFTNDAFMVNKGLANVLVKVFREPFKALFFLAVALSMSVTLTLAVLLVLPAVAFIIQRVGKRVKKSAQRSLRGVDAMATVLKETITGIPIVKSFRMEAYQAARIQRELDRLRKNLVRMARADAVTGPSTEFLMMVAMVAFILLSYRQITTGALTFTQLFALFGALALMLDPLRKLSTVNNMVQTSLASAERVFEFLDLRPEVQEKPNAVALPKLREHLRFENVSFTYDGDTEVLREIDFEIRRGEMVALIGYSGAGKSTVTRLIPRFYDVTGGRITLDGVDIRDVTLASLRDQIGIVTQDTVLFHDTVVGNLTFGSAFTEDAVRKAAAAANADGFIERLPQGFQTLLGEGGSNLSGGQRQRLAIARAIIKDPAILILDEATSSLDSESEKAIQEAIEQFVTGRTTLVIAHRLSTIRRADRILVLDRGTIVEAGTHDDLLALGGIYQRLYEHQFAPMKQTTAS